MTEITAVVAMVMVVATIGGGAVLARRSMATYAAFCWSLSVLFARLAVGYWYRDQVRPAALRWTRDEEVILINVLACLVGFVLCVREAIERDRSSE